MAINPTRMNLINTRKSIVIATKGHALLDNKKQVLVREFLTLLKDSSRGRTQMQEALQSAYKALAIGISYVGDLELERIASAVKEPEPVRIEQKNIMGVRIPEIEYNRASTKLQERGYGMLSASMAADDAHDSFVQALDTIIDVAKREQGLKRLIIAIDRVKRQVNALEYVRIPALNRQAKYIRMRLEEIDRDTFSALKHVKKRLRRSAEAE
jgi:V/A-type H+-transporting ATPase subunit D